MTLLLVVSLVISIISLLSGITRLEGPCVVNNEANNNNYTCMNDYSHTMNCIMNIPENFSHTENTSYWLEFDHRKVENRFNCSLRNTGNHLSCSSNGTEYSFKEYSMYRINFCTKSNGQIKSTLLSSNYRSMHHIKPVPPRSLSIVTIIQDFRHFRFSWEHGYSKYVAQKLKYQFTFYKNGFPNDSILHCPMNNSHHIEEVNLESDTSYTAKVRSGPCRPYKGQWSEWSNTVTWKTEKARVTTVPVITDPKMLLPFGNLTFLLYVTPVILLILFFSITASLKIKHCSNIPTPAPYFQPLYSTYKGNFQSWLLYPKYMEETYKTDEFLKIDTLADTKPICNEDTFQQPTSCQTLCQSPCDIQDEKDWDVHDQSDSLCSPVQLSFLKTSFTEMFDSQCLEPDDSGCEELTPSQDITEPQEVPSKEVQVPVYHDDYCTLSDTPNGLVPTLLFTRTSKEIHHLQCSEVDLSAKG